MAKIKKPDYYKATLKSRKDITAFIFDATSQRYYDHRPHPFCFNVKLHGLDLSFDNLLKKWIAYEGESTYQRNDDWLTAVKAKYAEIGEETLYEWGIEDASRAYVSGRDGTPDDDGTRTLWDGTELDVKYSFEGRSGGWLSLNEFEGFKFVERDYGADYWRRVMEKTDEEDDINMDYKTLRKLYLLIVQLKHDLRSEAVSAEVEHQAAFNFFANACSDIPQPDYVQPSLFTEEQLAGAE